MLLFELRLRGGALLDPKDRGGAAHLLAESMTAVAARRTPADLDQAIGLLVASIQINADRQAFTFRGSALTRHFDATMA